MKTINFDSIEFKNFLSVGNTPLNINFTEGINIITGENLDVIGSKNGIGKTTILNFVFWCIFGETITELKKSRIQNNKTKEECSGVLKLKVDGVDYSIKRILDPASIKILKNDEDITLSTIDKNNEFIKNLIGINQEVFKNSIILTSDNTIPFMAQKKIDKRKFIEGIMNLNVFGEMLLRIRKDFNETKKQSDIETTIFTNEQKNLENLKNQKTVNKNNKYKKIKELKDRILENKQSISDLEKTDINVETILNSHKAELQKKENELLSIENFEEETKKLTNIQIQKNVKKQNLSSIAIELKNLNNSKGSCPTCKRPYSEDSCNNEDKIKELNEQLKNLSDEIKVIETSENEQNNLLNKIKYDIITLKNNINDIKKEIERLVGLDNKIKILQIKNDEILKSIKNIIDEKDNTDDLIENTENNIKDHQNKIKTLFKELDILEQSKLIVSEEGVKTVIIKKILTFLNGRLNFYLSTLDAPCTCEFDETFETTIKNKNNKECDYWNFSGGERKRIDISVIFTFQDLLKMQSGIDFNIFIADELFDSAIDEKGLSKILEILRDRVNKYNQCIYIISHNPNTEKFDIDNTIFLEKKDGITKIKV